MIMQEETNLQLQQQPAPVQVKTAEIPPYVRLLAAPICCAILGLLVSPKFLVLALVYALVSARPLYCCVRLMKKQKSLAPVLSADPQKLLMTSRNNQNSGAFSQDGHKSNNNGSKGNHSMERRAVVIVETALRIHRDLTLQFSMMAACLWLYEHSRLVYSPKNNSNNSDDPDLIVHQAFDMAKRLVMWEHAVGLAIEPSLQGWVWNHAQFMILLANGYYAVLHFVAPLGIMARLIVYHMDPRWEHRAGFFIMLFLALIIFGLVPTMPPRLMPGYKFEYLDAQIMPTPLTDQEASVLEPYWNIIDTMKQGDTLYDKLHKEGGNPYAAMPSMHTGWALWSCLTWLSTIDPNSSDRSRLIQRTMAIGHVVCMVLVIIVTGNHFWLDAVAGATCVSIGRVLAYWLIGWIFEENGIVSRFYQRWRHSSYLAAIKILYYQTLGSSKSQSDIDNMKWRGEDVYDEQELTSSLTASISSSPSSCDGIPVV